MLLSCYIPLPVVYCPGCWIVLWERKYSGWRKVVLQWNCSPNLSQRKKIVFNSFDCSWAHSWDLGWRWRTIMTVTKNKKQTNRKPTIFMHLNLLPVGSSLQSRKREVLLCQAYGISWRNVFDMRLCPAQSFSYIIFLMVPSLVKASDIYVNALYFLFQGRQESYYLFTHIFMLKRIHLYSVIFNIVTFNVK